MSALNEFKPLNIAILTVSDTRTDADDTSGDALVSSLKETGHKLAEKVIVPDNIYKIRAIVSKWIADEDIQAVITTGGTGFTGRDSTPEAITPLLDKHVEGFGELFRSISHDEIGSSTIQSRALAGLVNKTVIFCVPGSTGACRTAWDNIIREQLDSTHRPCNFVGVLSTIEKQSRS